MNLSVTTPIKYSQGRLLQNDVKQKPTQDAATDDGCCTLHFALGIVNTRVYNIADNLGNFGIFFYLTILRINEAMLLPPLLEHLQSS